MKRANGEVIPEPLTGSYRLVGAMALRIQLISGRSAFITNEEMQNVLSLELEEHLEGNTAGWLVTMKSLAENLELEGVTKKV